MFRSINPNMYDWSISNAIDYYFVFTFFVVNIIIFFSTNLWCNEKWANRVHDDWKKPRYEQSKEQTVLDHNKFRLVRIPSKSSELTMKQDSLQNFKELYWIHYHTKNFVEMKHFWIEVLSLNTILIDYNTHQKVVLLSMNILVVI